MAGAAPWTDSLDDLSHVYRTQDAEVTGGAAQLAAGSTSGWVASSIITCPPGYRYDLVILEVVTPGASRVEISMLDASADPTEVGFANETVIGFKQVDATELAVTSIGVARYPEIRIQVNLYADGTDRPRLLSWTLHYIGTEEWRDEFLGTAKMLEHTNINLTGDQLEVDLSAGASGGGAGVGEYEPYPTIAIAGYYDVDILYPNSGHTGYENPVSIDGTYVTTSDFADFDQDGYLDILVADRTDGTYILRGSASGTYSSGSKTTVTTVTSYAANPGDFNGDGWTDVAIAGYGVNSRVFLNDGTGGFGAQADVEFSGSYYYIESGDVNGDSYDDIIIGYGTADVFYGGPQGPGTTADRSLGGGLQLCYDVNLDGFTDVLTRQGGSVYVYLGGTPDIDVVADYTLAGQGQQLFYIAAGDINGDGYVDISGVDYIAAANYDIVMFEGGSDGWKSSRTHSIDKDNYGRLAAADLDKDGFDDLVHIAYATGGVYRLSIFLGKSTWPTAASITKDVTYAYDIAFAIPKGEGGGPKAIRGTFETVPITIPLDRKWDVAYLEGLFPEGTSATVTVINDATGTAITGYKDLRSLDVDLGGVDPGIYRTIRLKVTILTEVNTTTPVLDALSVKWMDKREWRDEFYGPSKVDRMLNTAVADGKLQAGAVGGRGPQLVFSSLLGNANYTVSAMSFADDGAGDYLTREPFEFKVKGTTGASMADVNGDGFMDVAFSVRQTAPDVFSTKGPVYLGGPLGLMDTPDHRFDTTGASDVLLEDINDDGYIDAVFAQELKAVDDYSVGSILFWGTASGWASTPDLTFSTKGASDVEAADLDRDGDLDLVFACYRDTGTATDSMVFLQNATGDFCATVPDHRLPTKGARAVAVGDLDDDDIPDLVFANSQSGGFAEIDSYVYWGKAGGGYDATPLGLATVGAEDVVVADLDGDGDLDLVFANHWDNGQDLEVDSYVYLNDGSGGFGSGPAARLPTVGAAGVTVADIDGSGRLDLVFANQRNATSYQVPSYFYLGGVSGWSTTPDGELPTEGAYAVLAAHLVGYGTGGYLSKAIQIDLPARETGTAHTFTYTATLGGSQSAELMLIDAETWEVLGSTTMSTGAHDWDLQGLFRVKEHPVVRVLMVATGLEAAGQFTVDQLRFNWTQRDWQPPVVEDMTLSAGSVLRTKSVDIHLRVVDDYDLPNELVVTVQERLTGTTTWTATLVKDLVSEATSGTWKRTVSPKVNVPVGSYDLRVTALDIDGQYSPWLEFPNALEVLNNLPTTPAVRIEPEHALTTSSIKVEFDQRSTDVETTGLTYNFTWYRDGELVPEVVEDSVPTYRTAKGQNWTVEVRAWDGDDFSAVASAWVLIHNAPPAPKDVIPDPEMDEDTSDDTWVNLMNAFSDADGDPITWSLAAEPVHLTVVIDPVTGQVTFTPDENWFGEEDVTFVASDGEMTASQTVTVMVHSVNDLPVIDTVNGAPPTGDPMSFTVKQNGQLVITYTVADIEGDAIQADVSVTTVTLDEAAGTITFEPGDAVGTFTFTLRVWDVTEPSRKVSIGFTIEVENENDPMDVPQINRPATGSKYKVNETFSLVGECFDPDVQHGQVLTFTWTSNISGLLGTGASITVKLLDEGTHLITLTVSDGEFERSTTIEVIIEASHVEPPPPPDDDDDGVSIPWALIVGIIAALVVLGIVMFVFVGKRKTDEFEREMDELEEAETKKEALERTRDAIRDLADRWEEEAVDGEAVARAEAAGWEVEGHGGPAPEGTVAPAEVATPPLPPRSEEELRLDELKRSYQNAIGRLPFGVPSRELAGRDWVELAGLLATGERMTSGDGAELTAIEGRWYHSDPDDTDTFLREYREPRAEPPPDAPDVDRERLLAKLEERLILGEISEESYNELRRKYGG